MVRKVLACGVTLLTLFTGVAYAQDPPAGESTGLGSRAASIDPQRLPDCTSEEQNASGERLQYIGDVSCILADGRTMSADRIDVAAEGDETRIVAEGNAVLFAPDAFITARRFTYLASAGTGTFEDANGFLSLGPNTDLRAFGGQKPDVYFTGERLERLGPRRFRVTNGGWTACVQPTPRWQFTTGSMLVELDDYVLAMHTVLRVKGVPLFYWPLLYYPIQSDQRATGFLMPSLGTSTFRGSALSNAFFWALGRSHDATLYHDWFTRAGQGAGAEYRYVASPESSGNVRAYWFGRSATSFSEDGVTASLPGSTSFELTGNAVQTLAPGVVLRARGDYFSDVVSQQLLHQNLYDASRRSRLLEAGLTAIRGPFSSSVLYQRSEIINGVDDTLLYGGLPRASLSMAPQRLFESPIYASLNAEAAYLPYKRYLSGILTQDDSFGRFDVTPSVRVPLSRLTFLSVNTSAAYRTTYYTRQANEDATGTIDGSFRRQYATVRTDVVGPVVSKIFDVEGGFADRIKHVIEPTVTLDLISRITDYRRTPLQSDFSDFVVGGATRITYGITNRFFSRKAAEGSGAGSARGAAREFVTVGIQQTSYSNPEASRFDPSYSSALGSASGRRLSPIALTARVSPAPAFDGNARAEYDTRNGLQTFTAGAGISYGTGNVNFNYSRQRLDRTQAANSFLSATTRADLLGERVSGIYTINWDIARSYVVSQGIVASYMAQCCGIQGEYQQFNYPTGIGLPITADRRINFAFVLAGLGTFSNFFGAFGGN